MSTRALTLVVRLLTTACAGAALGTMTGCPFLFPCPEPWSEVESVELGTEADIVALKLGINHSGLIAVGAGGVVVVHDGDAATTFNPTNVTLRDAVASSGSMFVVGDGGTILESPDMGATWIPRDSTTTQNLISIARLRFTDGSIFLVACSTAQILVSADNGATWAEVVPPAQGWGGLRAVFAVHEQVWAIGDQGSAWSSTTPATAWLRQDLGTTATLIAGGRVSGEADSNFPSPFVIASADGLWFRDPDAGQGFVALSVDLDGPIAAYGGGFIVTTNGSIHEVDGAGSVLDVANVGLVPRAIINGLGGFVVAGDGGNAAHADFRPCVGGRPWVVDGRLTTAALELEAESVSSDGRGEISRTAASPLDEILALAWAEDGLYEHASVASFARAASELMSVGAPPELIRATLAAAGDELEHARLCFALASRHAGAPLRPGAIPLVAKTDNFGTVSDSRAGDPAAIARAVFHEGCINESVAAAEAAVAASECRDPQARAALDRIAADEARHAALAWRTLRWLLDAHGLRMPATGRTPSSILHASHSHADLVLRRHGRLCEPARAAIRRRVHAEMIAPLAHRLAAVTGEVALA